MHIPDGYLSLVSSLSLSAVSIPFLAKASQATKKQLDSKLVSTISLFSALSFVIMMFNIPLPGGTTGHAVGSVITSIVLGPWMATLAITVTLFIQALFFGDGGILALGANIFNMAIVMPLVGSAIYNFLDKWSNNNLKRKIIFSGIAGYLGINLAAFLVGLELGLQPILFHNPSGQSLYFPYSLGVSIPAMMIGHLTIAGLAEALVTGLGFSWILRTNPELIIKKKKGKKTVIVSEHRSIKFGLIVLGALILLTPLGLLAPGTAWGEWGREMLAQLGLGYIPGGFDKWSGLWKAPLANYNLPQLGHPAIAYILSALLGAGISLFLIWAVLLMMKVIKSNLAHKKGENDLS